ncbi:hypothetical protein [Alkalihalobacillus sp. BA299]|uniref:hypothetical protein n=1 Tax=Alkalihalobacillus sp. BA299 TaxID=2815938 RepID=UPI001ADA69B2|nr:hypothetical protein [Alkalihalobacillus sp. BA299]
MNNKVVLMYVMNDQIYPIALTEEQDQILQMTASLFAPLKVVDKPQGKAVNLVEELKKNKKA